MLIDSLTLFCVKVINGSDKSLVQTRTFNNYFSQSNDK